MVFLTSYSTFKLYCSREIVITRAKDPELWQDSEKTLPDDVTIVHPHPNIVEMYTAFGDAIPHLSDSMDLYPDALPSRINPRGFGRNMSLFAVMKRYDCTLREYLQARPDLSIREALMLLAQLLEGIVHLHRHKVAHRDLKSDNILIDEQLGRPPDGEEDFVLVEAACPRLVISDFGCCLADPRHGLLLPYPTAEVDKGGNAALMAPEVAMAVPGTFAAIDYSKADLWAAGTIAYEIFGERNPFYHGKSLQPHLVNKSYRLVVPDCNLFCNNC